MTTQKQRENILAKAYEIWEAEGRPLGRDMEHWMQAEMLIAAKDTKKKAKPAAKKKAAAKPKAKAKAKAKPKAKAPVKAKAKAKTKTKR